MDIAISPTFSLSALICLPILTLTAILATYWQYTCLGLKTKLSLVKKWAWGCGCTSQLALLILSILHFSKQINGGDWLWFTLNLLLRISYRCAIVLEYVEVLVNSQVVAPILTQRWLQRAPYAFILFSLVILPPRTLRGTSSSFSFYRNDVDFGTTFGIILLEVLLFFIFSLPSADSLALKYEVIGLAACACMLAGLHVASCQSKLFMLFSLLLPFLGILFWIVHPSTPILPEVVSTNKATQESLELQAPVGGAITESVIIDLENLPPTREMQQATTLFSRCSSSIIDVDPAPIDDFTMAESEQKTKLEWQGIQKDRAELEREKKRKGDRVDSSAWMPKFVEKD